jgi:hypothetical protein
MRGVVSIVELVIAGIFLLTMFSVLFPRFTYEHRWEEAMLLLRARDIILTLDRYGKLYEYSFDHEKLSNFLVDIFPKEELVKWGETRGTFKSEIIVACNCTEDEITLLRNYTGSVKINDRVVIVNYVKSELKDITKSDILLIWGYKNLTPYYTSIKRYLKGGSGIIEVMDFKGTDPEGKVNDDIVQTEIFGLVYRDRDNDNVTEIIFRKTPETARDLMYPIWKYFYHIPLPLIPKMREDLKGCMIEGGEPKGNFTIKEMIYAYWICDQNSVWWDTDGDGVNDTLVTEGETFSIAGFNFTLSYVDETMIGVKFNRDYIFDDFLGYIKPPGEPDPEGKALGVFRVYDVYPIDGNEERILLYGVSPNKNYSACILNPKEAYNVAWLTDISKDDRVIQDDERFLLLTLILWASNKRGDLVSEVKYGILTSYINVVNKDLFEVYEFGLGIGYPY